MAASSTLLVACNTPDTVASGNRAPVAGTQPIKLQQICNATLKVEYAGTIFLVDPMLAAKGAYPGFEGTYNSHLRNALVDLPVPANEAMKADAVIVTHTHPDHWDEAARKNLPKTMPIFAQNEADAASVRKDGFTDVRVLTQDTVFRGTRLSKTAGQHGSDQMTTTPLAKILGDVSGVVFRHPGHKTVYIAGDTVWNRPV